MNDLPRDRLHQRDADIERRLRRALHARAEADVADDHPLPDLGRGTTRRTAALRPSWLPMAAAVVAVLTVAGGSVAVGVADRSTHHDDAVASTTVASSGATNPGLGATGTGTGSAPALVPPTNSTTPRMRSSTGHTSAPRSRDLSSSSSSPTHVHRRSSPDIGTATPTESDEPTTPSASSAPPSSDPGDGCAADAIDLSVGGDRQVGTQGGDYTFLVLANTGAPCTLNGYPTVRIFDGNTQVSGTVAHRSPGPSAVLLAHGARAEFEIYDVDHGSGTCTANYDVDRTLRTVLPGQSSTITISYGYSPCSLSVTAIHPQIAHP